MLWIILYLFIVQLSSNTALKNARLELQKYLAPPPPESDVNLKTGQSVNDNILLWSLYSTLYSMAVNAAAPALHLSSLWVSLSLIDKIIVLTK